ncbi:MAG: tRNA (adenosine(37)-N6)-threonylcarbamoyltransferase complex transferase subunit TsaD [Magnetococcales bacterium]|nr:tRNA (adenosine(37)-N6)-threonylcarbamoyltransferase complex transferase subunit TsaD [Magnetococcales bacterium]
MIILGLESSCDETAAAIVEIGEDSSSLGDARVRAGVVLSQLEEHARHGGVVPELASRAHIRHFGPVIARTLEQAGVAPGELDAVAVTQGPGLIGGLLVGLAIAKGVALAAGIPLVGVHHMEGHLLSPFLAPAGAEPLDFPFVALLVSGGHTILLHVRGVGDYGFLGATRDDAVGEAFDKGARLLGLGYPGGPAIEQVAREGDCRGVAFPRILLDKDQFDFSFSGLKTALKHELARQAAGMAPRRSVADVAASYQEAIIDTLTFKALRACRHVGCRRLLVAGGVGANQGLRERLRREGAREGLVLHFPPLAYCTDNAAMIALAGWVALRRRLPGHSWMTLDARPRWPIRELCRDP